MTFLNKRHMLEAIERAKSTGASEHRDSLPTWCPGCGHFTPLQAIYEAIERLKVPARDFVLVSGIGCSGRFPFFIKGFGLHSLHGRAVPIATGIKMANPRLCTVVVGGDGDGVGIGGGHFPHAARINIDMTYLLLDNSIYGLTKGQASPTSPTGMISSTTPYGNIARPLNPSVLAITYGATYVARVFSRERDMVTDLITDAIAHKGFSFVHVISPCIEFNKTITFGSVHAEAELLPSTYKPDNRSTAIQIADQAAPLYQGLLYKEDIPTFHERADKITARLG